MDAQAVVNTAAELDASLSERIRFLLELDKLKSVIRRSYLIDESRLENTAEHSWHLGMLALVLAPHADGDVDVARAVAMLLVHDLVEIDAGDTFVYDDAGRSDKAERERTAAHRIFGLLPDGQGAELRALWDEYEERITDTARFAYACDRLQPLLLNASANGPGWREHGIVADQVRTVNRPIGDGSVQLWSLASALIERSAAEGLL